MRVEMLFKDRKRPTYIRDIDPGMPGPTSGGGRLDGPENEFMLRFDGNLNEINASTLGYSLINMATLVSEATREVDTVATVEMKVQATAPGSFEVFLSLHSELTGVFQLLGPDGLAKASAASLGIIKIVAESLKLRKLLKGEPPEKTTAQGETYEIQARQNAKVSIDRRTYNLYFNHPEVNEALSNIFKALDADRSVQKFEMTDGEDNQLFEATREDFAPMALSTSVPQPETRQIYEDTTLYVIKPSFERKLKWDVLYHSIRIPVTLKDERFLNRVETGEKFAKGDTLIVNLRIQQKLDKQLRTYVNKTYEIMEVKQHVPYEALVQGRLELPPAEEK
jgi:hypothetical protein